MTILRASYLHNGVSYTDKRASLYWIRAQASFTLMRISSPSVLLETPFYCNSIQKYMAAMFAHGTITQLWFRQDVIKSKIKCPQNSDYSGTWKGVLVKYIIIFYMCGFPNLFCDHAPSDLFTKYAIFTPYIRICNRTVATGWFNDAISNPGIFY